MKKFAQAVCLVLACAGIGAGEVRLPVPRLADDVPVSRREVEVAMSRGVAFLLSNQNADGSWGRYLKTLSDPVACPAPYGPLSFRVGTTSLDMMALMQAAPDDARARAAVDRAAVWLLRELPRLRRPSVDVLYNNWGYAYGLQALCALARRDAGNPEKVEEYRRAAMQVLAHLNRYSNLKGGWGYYEFADRTARPSWASMSFMTAAVLVAVKEAELCFNMGLDQPVCNRALALIRRLRTPEGTFLYGDHMIGTGEAAPVNRHLGSLGRTAACNHALFRYGVPLVGRQDVSDGLDWMWARNGWLLLAKKWPIPHESFGKNAGYFVFFGYYYAGLSLEIAPPETRARHARLLARILLPQQEPSGCWWDFPMMDYHRQYGTGFALMALSCARACLPEEQRLATGGSVEEGRSGNGLDAGGGRG